VKGRRTACAFDLITWLEVEMWGEVCVFMWRKPGSKASAGCNFWHANGRALGLGAPGQVPCSPGNCGNWSVAGLKGGQNTRYLISEPELPETRPEVLESELPDHNFG
jgi:hypothetical protein